VATSTPADFSWGREAGPHHTPASWVEPFRQRETARQQQAYRDYMNQPTDAGGSLLVGAVLLVALVLVVLCLAWPVRALRRWQGPWRTLCVPPLLVAGLWLLKDITDIAADPTAHNLWPFECVEAALLIGAYMLVLTLLRRWQGAD
jgi:hypothetical protein